MIEVALAGVAFVGVVVWFVRDRREPEPPPVAHLESRDRR